uniref:Uncharacterized protein n=1 Tax=Triticum urartu TaxID=4572 RepID=A0A8R7PGW8_TRIUA
MFEDRKKSETTRTISNSSPTFRFVFRDISSPKHDPSTSSPPSPRTTQSLHVHRSRHSPATARHLLFHDRASLYAHLLSSSQYYKYCQTTKASCYAY